MISRVLLFFIVLLLSVWLGIQLNQDPGYLLIEINNWTVETTLWFAIISAIVFFVLLHVLILIISKIWHFPHRLNTWRNKRRVQQAQDKTRRGLIEFSEGYWDRAKTHLIKALPDTDTPLLNYLTAARAAQELGDYKLRDDYLREAQQSMPEAKIAVELTQAQLQLANQQWEQALATLRHLQDLAPKHPYVLKLLMRLYQEVRDWPQLIALLPELKKHHILSDQEFNALRHYAYQQLMSDLIKQRESEALTKLVENLPKHLKYDPDLMTEYCRYLSNNNQAALAESLLKQSLKKQFNEKLINLYGQIHSKENQLIFAESLLKKHGNSSELMLCLGRLSASNHLWGKAKSYFERSIELKPTPKTYEELGKLLERLNDHAGACEAYQKGLVLR